MCGLCQGFELSKLENESNSSPTIKIFTFCESEIKLCETWKSRTVVNAVKLSKLEVYQFVYKLFFIQYSFLCFVIDISCMYCLASLPPNISVCIRPGKHVDILLNWSLQNCTVPIIMTMKNERVLPSFVVAFVYDLIICYCSK